MKSVHWSQNLRAWRWTRNSLFLIQINCHHLVNFKNFMFALWGNFPNVQSMHHKNKYLGKFHFSELIWNKLMFHYMWKFRLSNILFLACHFSKGKYEIYKHLTRGKNLIDGKRWKLFCRYIILIIRMVAAFSFYDCILELEEEKNKKENTVIILFDELDQDNCFLFCLLL